VIDYSDWVYDAETLQTAVAVSALHSGNADDSGNPFAVTGVQIQTGDLTVAYTASGGAHGNTYKVTFTVTTNTPQTREDEILVKIREV